MASTAMDEPSAGPLRAPRAEPDPNRGAERARRVDAERAPLRLTSTRRARLGLRTVPATGADGARVSKTPLSARAPSG